MGWGCVRSSVVSGVGMGGGCRGICCEWSGDGCVRASVVNGVWVCQGICCEWGGVGVCQGICCEWGEGASDHLL